MSEPASEPAPRTRAGLLAASWLWVSVPFAYGMYELVRKVIQLFTG